MGKKKRGGVHGKNRSSRRGNHGRITTEKARADGGGGNPEKCGSVGNMAKKFNVLGDMRTEDLGGLFTL